MTDVVALLAAELKNVRGRLTRRKVEELRKGREKRRKPNSLGISAPTANIEAAEETAIQESVAQSIPSSQVEKQTVSVVLVDLRARSDMTKMGQDYVHGGEPSILKAGLRMTSDTSLVIVLKLKDVAVVSSKLSFWLKKRIDRVFLFDTPASLEVSDEIAAVICSKEKHAFSWLDSAQYERDPVDACIKGLTGWAEPRLLLLAQKEVAGWECVVGEENWL